MIPVCVIVTLEDLYDTCVCHCYIGGFVWYLCLPLLHWRICMIPVFASVTLEDFYGICVCQCYIGGFV